jgi:hypothetical protein
MLIRRVLLGAVAALLCLMTTGADAAGVTVSMLDRLGVAQGSAKITLATGAVTAKVALASLPATIETGAAPFQATCYRAYLLSSTDPAVEISLGAVWPSVKNAAQVKAAFKGDVSKLGLDRLVIVAYSKDGLSSFDVLTGTIAPL